MSLAREQFVESLSVSGVLSTAEVQAFMGALPPERRDADAETLARELVQQGKLTKYQAAAVFQGKTKGPLIMKRKPEAAAATASSNITGPLADPRVLLGGAAVVALVVAGLLLRTLFSFSGTKTENVAVVTTPAGVIEKQLVTVAAAPMPPTTPPEKPASPAAAGAARLPVPGNAAAQKAESELKDVYKDEFAHVKQPDEKSALAEKLLAEADKLNDDPVVRYVMLTQARQLTADAGDLARLEHVVARLVEQYDVDRLDLLAGAWEEMLRKPRGGAPPKAVAEAALGLVQSAIAVGRWEMAKRLGDLAVAAARKTKDAAFTKQVAERGKELAAASDQWQKAHQAEETLRTNPADAEANLALGKYRAFACDDWPAGLAYLAKGSDAALRDLAAKSLAAPTDAAGRVTLGDAWFDAAERAKGRDKDDLQAAARYWYIKAVDALSGLDKVRVEKRLNDMASLGGKRPADRNLRLDPLRQIPPPASVPFDAAAGRDYQERWARYLKLPVVITNSIGMKLVVIPPGEFTMGTPNADIERITKTIQTQSNAAAALSMLQSEAPQHRVRLTQPILIGEFEVTIGQFKRFADATGYKTRAETNGAYIWSEAEQKTVQSQKNSWRNPGYPTTDDLAVNQLCYDDAVAFCEWLSTQEGGRYRLPTEAEWEFACRAGTATLYWFGNDAAQLKEYAWVGGQFPKRQAQPVGSRPANPFGLFEVHGHMDEWCSDWYAADYYTAATVTDPKGPPEGTERSVRSGQYYNGGHAVRSGHRFARPPVICYYTSGFRVVRELPVKIPSPW